MRDITAALTASDEQLFSAAANYSGAVAPSIVLGEPCDS